MNLGDALAENSALRARVAELEHQRDCALEDYEKAMHRVSQLEAQRVPDGYRLPVVLTKEMMHAFREAYKEGSIWTDRLTRAVEALLAATPQPTTNSEENSSSVDGALFLLVAAGNRIEAEAEECETADGLAVTIDLSYWHEFTAVLGAARDALEGFAQPADQSEHPLDMVPAEPVDERVQKAERARDAMIREIEDLAKENAHLRATRFKSFSDKEYWVYQGDGTDYLESLVVPVVISAAQLLDIIGDGRGPEKESAAGGPDMTRFADPLIPPRPASGDDTRMVPYRSAEFWHQRYVEQCRKRADDAARYGSIILGLEADIAELKGLDQQEADHDPTP